jgi:hypothetical protein
VNFSGTAKWVLLALAGLAVAIGIAIAAANLTSQQIGIASESVSAGDALAPALQAPAHAGGHGDGQPPNQAPIEPTTTTPETTMPVPEETTDSDDHGGGSDD